MHVFACMHFYGPHVYASVQRLGTCYLRRPKEGIKSSGTGVTDNCKTPSVCWGFNPGPPEERQMLLQLNHFSSPPIKWYLKNIPLFCILYVCKHVCIQQVCGGQNFQESVLPFHMGSEDELRLSLLLIA